MKIIKNYLALIVCLLMLLPGMSVKVKAAPAEVKKPIVIATGSDIKGCYYDGTTTPDTADDKWNDEPCFADPILGDNVFEALVEFYGSDDTLNMQVNQDGALESKTDTSMRQVLYDFRGDIDAKKKGIESIKGIQFLIHAQTIDLRNNQIKDFTDLNVSAKATDFKRDHYGYGAGEDPDNPSESRNVVWKLGGNPFEKLPYSLGGRLVIEAAQTTSSQYPDKIEFVFKRDATETFFGELDIAKCQIMDYNDNGVIVDSSGNATYRDVHVTTINFVKTATDDNHIIDVDDTGIELDKTKGDLDKEGNTKGYTDKILYFTGLQTSRQQKIGIGADQEIHYVTADEFDTNTPGSQSFKYYLDPMFYVYDSVTVSAEENIPVKLRKVDSTTGVGLAKAEFQVLNSLGDAVGGTYSSDNNGYILVEHLPVGQYSLKETKAPIGYDINSAEIPFEITKNSVNSMLKISGGTGTFTTTGTNPTTFNATADVETYIAGPLDNDIILSQTGNDTLTSVVVTYLRVSTDGTKIENDIVEKFNSLKEAEDAINAKKKAGHIYGSISVMGYLDGSTIELTHENTKTSTPPSNPGTPNKPSEPDIPLIPLVPAEPIEPETPTTPEEPTVPVTPTSPQVPNTSTESLKEVWVILMVLSLVAVISIFVKARKEN